MLFFRRFGVSLVLFLAHGICCAQEVDFNLDVLPILSDHCFPCHGPDSVQRQADLRLDSREGLFEDLGGYAAFVPGNVEESAALDRIFSDDPYERMPPDESNLEMTDKQKQVLRSWVEQGAHWNEHWAFVIPTKPELPKVKRSDWPYNDLDLYVLSRLEKNGLSPSPAADPHTLIRRVTLDLTGLPPTPEEVAAYVSDPTLENYERVVDRLLSSSRYGERMAWPWLDAARYADTDGFQADPTRDMWPWRDWLIGALNDNMPYDQFTIEMLAGDMLPNATAAQIIASGFNRNHMYNGEGGRIAEETRIENVFDRTETTATVWLGLTMTCARCHDHKFDPISQKEYYELFAFFNNTSESGAGGSGRAAPTVRYLSPRQQGALDELTKQIAAITEEMNRPDEDLDLRQRYWESDKIEEIGQLDLDGELKLSPWQQLGPLPAPDGLASAAFYHIYGPENGVDLKQEFEDGKFSWQEKDYEDGKVQALPNPVGTTFLYRVIEFPVAKTLELSLGSDDSIQVWHNGQQVLANDVARGVKADQEKLLIDLQPGENQFLMKIVNTGGAAGFYFAQTGETVAGLPLEIVDALLIEPADRNQEQLDRLRDHYRGAFSKDWQDKRSQQAELNRQRERISQSAAVVMVMDDLPTDRTRKTYVLDRGVYNKPLDEVTRSTPSFLPAMPSDLPVDRLGLAQWLVSPENPLAARVTVNRHWQMFFGAGLVDTSEDFGRQGGKPIHPELLDGLSTGFVNSGWDVKALHKQIVMSATYRQSSHDPGGATSYEADPGNKWLARGARFRMPSWMLRDQALALSGLLVEQVGGPPVRPYQPAGIWAEATFGKITYSPGSGDDLYRRSLYTFWRRIVGPTMFFDEGKRQTCVVRPSRTNSPLHALTTLNETTFVESARLMAERVMAYPTEGVDDASAARLAHAFSLATARPPTPGELTLLRNRWSKLQDHFANDSDAAEQLLSVGQRRANAELDRAELAAYTVICSLILNLDEVLTRE